MSTRTIEIEDDAFARLDADRRDGESFSQVLRRWRPAAPAGANGSAGPPPDRYGSSLSPEERAKIPLQTIEHFNAVMKRLAADPLSDEAIAAVEQVIADRDLPINRRDLWADADAEEALEEASRRAEPERR